jgi:hypothetical protein
MSPTALSNPRIYPLGGTGILPVRSDTHGRDARATNRVIATHASDTAAAIRI